MTDQDIRTLTDLIYVQLFGLNTKQLRQRLGITGQDTINDDLLRDAMGVEALEALGHVEGEIARRMLAQPRPLNFRQTAHLVEDCALAEREHFRRLCASKGVDRVTGRKVGQA